jgi:hypothetical protein
MSSRAPFCQCGGAYVCAQCGDPLRKALQKSVEKNSLPAYTSAFPRGPRGGAMIDLAPLIRLECFVPFVEPETGDILSWLPMPLLGDVVIHDLTRSKFDDCAAGLCRCERPVGWRLTRPLIRAITGWSDAAIYEHSGSLPGRIRSSWQIAVDTLEFMRAVVFGDYQFPTRAEARAERRAARCRRRCKPPRPADRRPLR